LNTTELRSNAVTGKVPVRPATSTFFVQVLIAFVVFPSVCFRISSKKPAAHPQRRASAIHEMRDAWKPVSVPPGTPDGTMSLELLIAACSSIVKSKLPLVRVYSHRRLQTWRLPAARILSRPNLHSLLKYVHAKRRGRNPSWCATSLGFIHSRIPTAKNDNVRIFNSL
jgi:hypothetical protein